MFNTTFKRIFIPLVLSLTCGLGFMLYSSANNTNAPIHPINNFTFIDDDTPAKAVPCKGSCIKLALLLDTSSSMNGLIEQAKSQLWRIVKELSQTERNGEDIGLQIALYEYGNDRLDIRNGYIKQLSPLTSDIDLISEKLFSLTTNGGSEYCGKVIKTSLDDLDWGKEDGELKLVYIAGNESFAQGPFNYTKACSEARENNIVVNTIFCGDYKEGISLQWKHGASQAAGEYMNIDHNQQTVYYEAPQDDELDALNKALNDTYISYGDGGAAKIEAMKMNDSNAALYSKANKSDRIAYKSSKMYKNSKWDLIDAYEEKKDKVLKEVKKLPAKLKGKSEKEIKAFIEDKKEAREAIKNKIKKLSKERDAYIAKKRTENSNDLSLDENILNSVKKQAKEKGYSF